MIPAQFDRFELAGKVFIWVNPRSPKRNDELGAETWLQNVQSVGPRLAKLTLSRRDREGWFLDYQADCLKAETETRKISEQEAATRLQRSGAAIPAEAVGTEGGGKKTKVSTHNGDANDSIVSAFTAHHKYSGGGATNHEPIGNNELKGLAGVRSTSTASAFFKKHFDGHARYAAACRLDFNGRVLPVLKALNGDYCLEDTYGKVPPGEQEREDT